MRAVILGLAVFIGAMSFIDLVARLDEVTDHVPLSRELRYHDIALQALEPFEECPSAGRYKRCRWQIKLTASNGRSWPVYVPATVEIGGANVGSIRPGDRVRIGVYDGQVFTIARLDASQAESAADNQKVVVDEIALERWSDGRLAEHGGWLVFDLLCLLAAVYLYHSEKRRHPLLLPATLAIGLTSVIWCLLLDDDAASIPTQAGLWKEQVQYAASVSALRCERRWPAVRQCDLSNYLLDTTGGAWLLAAPLAPKTIEPLAWIEVGHVRRHVFQIRSIREAPANCGYRQDPRYRMTMVRWLCDREIQALSREPKRRPPVDELSAKLEMARARAEQRTVAPDRPDELLGYWRSIHYVGTSKSHHAGFAFGAAVVFFTLLATALFVAWLNRRAGPLPD